jgi:hypothetical protein
MAIAGLGNGCIPATKIEALAHQLRFLISGMADLQGRLDTLLSEIDAELQQAQADSEPAAEVVVDVQAVAEAGVVAAVASEPVVAEVPAAPEAETVVEVMQVAEASEASEIEAVVVAEPIVELTEAAQSETIAPVETADAAAVLEFSAIEPAAVETAVVEIAEVIAPVEAVAETPTVVDAIPTVASTEPVAHVAVWAEPVAPAAEQIDAPAAKLPGQNVVVLAEHRERAGKRRGVIARTARWAAAIALIATVAAVAATGTGFAGNGELILKNVCTIAGEGCSITLGMP